MPRSQAEAFSDSDWTSEAAATGPRRDQRPAAALVAGVAIGALVASLVWWFATVVRAPLHQPAPADAAPVAATAPPPAAPVAAARASEVASEAPAPASPVVAAAPAALPITPPAEPAATTAVPAPSQTTLADDAARRKERAWRKFYQPPSICSEDRRGEFLVECANHSIRARKEFEERYATGRL